MITRVEVLGYRCLQYVAQDLSPFIILVGPNGAGKSTFLDVIGFVSDALTRGARVAVEERAVDLVSLFWRKEPTSLEIALEIAIPATVHHIVELYPRVRYELAVGWGAVGSGELTVLNEALWLLPPRAVGARSTRHPDAEREFPAPVSPPKTILWCKCEGARPGKTRKSVQKTPSGHVFFSADRRTWRGAFKYPLDTLALSGLPEDHEKFPISLWVRDFLMARVQPIFLNSSVMRSPSSSGSVATFRRDGSNLPWLVDTLRKDRGRFALWLSHVRTALPDIKTIRTVERPEDRTRFLMIGYKGGLELPSWSASDGTLRLLALTLIPYINDYHRMYLIEEPENGIHPKAVEFAYQSLSSAYSSQVLCTSHSPIMLSLVEPEQILCLARDASGATDVVRGDQHPLLLDWRRSTDLGTLFAAGVLG